MSHLRSENSWVAFIIYCLDTFTTWKLIWFRWVHRAGKKISTTLGSVSTSTHERHKSSWCVRWHSKHCCLCRTELLLFSVLFSACEWRPRARLLSVAGKQKHEHVFMPYSWILQGMAHLFGGHEPPQLGQIKHLWGLHPWGENMVFYYIKVKRAMACWNVLLPCGLFYTDFNYAPTSFESLTSAAKATLPAQLCAEPCVGRFQRHARDSRHWTTPGACHTCTNLVPRTKTNSLFCSFRSWDVLTNTG